MRNINSFEDIIRLALRIIARCMLLGGIIIFAISLVRILMNYMQSSDGNMNTLLGEIGYRIVVLGTPCVGLSFVGYGLLSRLIGVRLVLFIVGLFILLYYGWLYTSVRRDGFIK